jgi:hypothetical protein
MVEILKEGDETLATLYRAILEDLTTVAIEPIPQNIIGDFVGGCVSIKPSDAIDPAAVRFGWYVGEDYILLVEKNKSHFLYPSGMTELFFVATFDSAEKALSTMLKEMIFLRAANTIGMFLEAKGVSSP